MFDMYFFFVRFFGRRVWIRSLGVQDPGYFVDLVLSHAFAGGRFHAHLVRCQRGEKTGGLESRADRFLSFCGAHRRF